MLLCSSQVLNKWSTNIAFWWKPAKADLEQNTSCCFRPFLGLLAPPPHFYLLPAQMFLFHQIVLSSFHIFSLLFLWSCQPTTTVSHDTLCASATRKEDDVWRWSMVLASEHSHFYFSVKRCLKNARKVLGFRLAFRVQNGFLVTKQHGVFIYAECSGCIPFRANDQPLLLLSPCDERISVHAVHFLHLLPSLCFLWIWANWRQSQKSQAHWMQLWKTSLSSLYRSTSFRWGFRESAMTWTQLEVNLCTLGDQSWPSCVFAYMRDDDTDENIFSHLREKKKTYPAWVLEFSIMQEREGRRDRKRAV